MRFSLSENGRGDDPLQEGLGDAAHGAAVRARAGSRAVTVRGSKLSKGRYSVEIEARDARGNRAPLARKTVRVTR